MLRNVDNLMITIEARLEYAVDTGDLEDMAEQIDEALSVILAARAYIDTFKGCDMADQAVSAVTNGAVN